VPVLGFINPIIVFNKLDFPDPFGPKML